MTSIWDRSATAASNTATPPAGFPVDQVPSLVAPQFRAEMAYETEFVHSIAATSATAITNESLGTGNGATTTFSGTLINHGIKPGTLTVTAGSVVGTDNGGGTISGTGISAGSINYATGAWSITYATAPTNAVAITAAYTPDGYIVTFVNVPGSLTDGMEIHVRAPAANASTNPKLNVNSLGAAAITKLGGSALAVGDIAGALHELDLRYNVANTRWELLNPNNAIATSFLMPTGAVMPYAGSAAPTGWLLLFGQAVSRTTYATLFGIIGTTYGSGDGSTTFNVPDMRGRLAAGVDNMGGTAANRITSGNSGISGTTVGAAGGDERLQQHLHGITDGGHNHPYLQFFGGSGAGQPSAGGGGNTGSPSTGSTSTATTGITIQNAGAGNSQNVQPTMMLNYIIKT